MNCPYCNIAILPRAARCHGCGAPCTTPLAEPVGTAASIYEQIGRAVVHRQQNAALDGIIRIGERKDASTTEQKVMRGTKALGVLIVMFAFPQVFSLLFAFGCLWLFWYYLPMKAVKTVWNWIRA